MARAQCERPLDINTQKLVNSFNFFKNGEFSFKYAKNDKMFHI